MTHSIPDAMRGGADAPSSARCSITGDYKFDQTPVDGTPGRRQPPGRARPRGPAAAVRRLDERRPPGLLAQRVGRRARTWRRSSARCEGRIVVTCFASNIHRVQQVVDAAAGARAQGRARRPLDAQEHQHRALAGPHRRARGHARAAARDRRLPRPQARDHLDRLPGRAAERAAPHGPPRPSAGRAARRRHRRLRGDADPRQRARGQRDDRPALPHRLRRDHDPRRADPRLRPRLRGGDQADAQPRRGRGTSCRSTATTSASTCTASSPRRSGVAPEQHLQGRERPAAGDRRATARASARASARA